MNRQPIIQYGRNHREISKVVTHTVCTALIWTISYNASQGNYCIIIFIWSTLHGKWFHGTVAAFIAQYMVWSEMSVSVALWETATATANQLRSTIVCLWHWYDIDVISKPCQWWCTRKWFCYRMVTCTLYVIHTEIHHIFIKFKN